MRPSSSARSPNSPAAGFAPAWAQAGWFALVALAWSTVVLTFRVDPDYTAGELLDHLQSWRETGVLYPALSPLGTSPPLRVFNYPPLVMIAARGLTAIGVPALAAGRVVNTLGLLALVAAVIWWTPARGARGAAVAGTVGLLGASFPVLYGAGQFHLELWAAAGTAWGFALLHRAETRPAAALGGLALALACFAKQAQVVPSLVALGWIVTTRRRVAGAALVAFIGAAIVGAAGITLAWGAEPWRQIVTYTVGTYSVANLGLQALSHLAPWLILVGFAVRTGWSERSVSRDPALWYLVGALVWSVSAARIGSGYPYFLDVHIATVILVGPRLFGSAGNGSPIVSRAWRWLLAAQVVGANIGAASALAVNVARLARTDAELPALCASLGDQRQIVAEEAGLLRACGRPALIHPFIMTSLAARGLWDPSPFEAGVRNGRYPVAVLPFDPRLPAPGAHAERWTAGALAAFKAAPTVERAPAGQWVARW